MCCPQKQFKWFLVKNISIFQKSYSSWIFLEECNTWATLSLRETFIKHSVNFVFLTKYEIFRSLQKSMFKFTALLHSNLSLPWISCAKFLVLKSSTLFKKYYFVSFNKYTYISHNKCLNTNVMDAYPWRLLKMDKVPHLNKQKPVYYKLEQRIPATELYVFF